MLCLFWYSETTFSLKCCLTEMCQSSLWNYYLWVGYCIVFCVLPAQKHGRIDEGMGSSSSFVGGPGPSSVVLDYIKLHCTYLVASVFCPHGDTCRFVICLPLLRSYSGYLGAFQIFQIISSYFPFTYFSPNWCGIGETCTLGDSPFPVTSLVCTLGGEESE